MTRGLPTTYSNSRLSLGETRAEEWEEEEEEAEEEDYSTRRRKVSRISFGGRRKWRWEEEEEEERGLPGNVVKQKVEGRRGGMGGHCVVLGEGGAEEEEEEEEAEAGLEY